MASPGTLSVDRITASKQESISIGSKLLAPHFLKLDIPAMVANEATNITDITLNGKEAVLFPGTGAPEGEFSFTARAPQGQSMFFEFNYAMSTSVADKKVQIDADIYVEGTLIKTLSEIIDVPDDDSSTVYLTQFIFIDATEFNEGEFIKIVMRRDPTVADNHTGGFAVSGLQIQ